MKSLYQFTTAAGISFIVAAASGPGAYAQEASGPAYIVVELNVTDAENFQEYAQKVPETIAQYGGAYIVRGGNVEPLEGAEPDGRVVILRFDSVEDAHNWMNSPEYTAIKDIRSQTAKTRSYLVEGLPAN